MRTRSAKLGNPKTAVGYIRVSTDEQALGQEAQRNTLEAFAARQGMTIVSWHEDIGVSGAAGIDACPGLLGALQALRGAKAGALLVVRRDRLARDVVKAAMAERLAEREGAKVVSAAGEGGDDPAGQLMRRIVDAFAEYERHVIIARTKAALAVKRSRGERISLHAPYGHTFENGKVIPCPAEQAIITTARACRAGGMTIAAIIEAIGPRNRKGKKFDLHTMHNLVRPDAAA